MQSRLDAERRASEEKFKRIDEGRKQVRALLQPEISSANETPLKSEQQ